MSRWNENYFTVPCECGCCKLEVSRYDFGDGETDYDISVLDSRYDHNVNGILGRLRRAFGVLVGRPVYFNDVYLDQEGFDRLLERMRELRDGVHVCCPDVTVTTGHMESIGVPQPKVVPLVFDPNVVQQTVTQPVNGGV